MVSARNLTNQGAKWAEAANGYYHMTPANIETRRGFWELIGDTNELNDLDYENVKQMITDNTHGDISMLEPEAT